MSKPIAARTVAEGHNAAVAHKGSAPSDIKQPLPLSSNLFGKGSVALITGGTRGLGYHTAVGLGKKGITVVITGRDEAKGNESIAALQKDVQGIDADFVALEVVNQESIDAAVKYVTSKYKKLDILVNNAAIFPSSQNIGLETTVADLREVYEANVFGVYAVTKSFLPLLRLSKHPRVVNVSSFLGSLTNTSESWASLAPYLAYNSTKSAVNALTVQLSNELKKEGFKINAADPGYCNTDMTGGYGPRPAAQGAVASVNLATVDDIGPTGAFYNDEGREPW